MALFYVSSYPCIRQGLRDGSGSFDRISLDTRFRGYDETGARIFRSHPQRVFSNGEHEGHGMVDSPNSAISVFSVVSESLAIAALIP
jgi:hypothetical protein